MEKLLTIINGPRLTSCSFDRRPIAEKIAGPTNVVCSAKAKVMINDKTEEVIISLTVASDTPEVPFKFSVEMEVLYKIVNKKASSVEIEKAGRIEIGSSLFALIRDFIAELTRKAGITPLWISYIDFSKVKGIMEKNDIVSKKKSISAK